MIDIRAAQIAGHEALRKARAAKDAATKGHPRVGSSGCVAESGDVHGVCPRIVLARQLGIEPEPEIKTEIMWLAGEVNEIAWARVVDAGLPAGVTRATGVNIVKYHIDGVPLPVLGHPDVMFERNNQIDCGAELERINGEPGGELKGMFGTATAVLVGLHNTPKNENLIQAATYSLFMDKVDWALSYTNPNYAKLDWRDAKEFGIKTLEPFYKTFYLEWCGPEREQLCYRSEDADELTPTVVTGKGIKDYYRLVEEMKQRKDLGARPSSHYVCGTPNKWGRESMCGLCGFKGACAAYDGDKDYDNWIDAITEGTKGEAA